MLKLYDRLIHLSSGIFDFIQRQSWCTIHAKSAVLGMTKSLAAYYAKDNIRFNVLAPALVDTPMATRATNDSEIMQFIRTKQPLDGSRIGQPSDLDAAVVYFLSDDSRFVTGQVLAVDGGWSVSEGQYS